MTFYVELKNVMTGSGEDGDGQPIEIWEVIATPLSAESADNLRGALRADVSSMSYVPHSEGASWREIAFHGPKPPVRYTGGDYEDPNASGIWGYQSQVILGPDIERFRETLEITFIFDNGWPFENRRGALILEYEGTTELLYKDVDFYGNPSVWMYGQEDGQVTLVFDSTISTGLGMSSFKLYTLGDGAPAEPFWTEMLGCTELA